MTSVEILPADTAEGVAAVRALLSEYIASLDIDLSFQGVAKELADLSGAYAAPRGCLLLALSRSLPVGSVGVRPLETRICEMKRLYVRSAARGAGLGRRLALEAIAFARRSGYSFMRLDTLPSMVAARRLYAGLGFHDIPPYRFNPVRGTAFMELEL